MTKLVWRALCTDPVENLEKPTGSGRTLATPMPNPNCIV